MSRLSITGTIWHFFFPSKEQRLQAEKQRLNAEIKLLDLEKEVETRRQERDRKRKEVDQLKGGLPPDEVKKTRRLS